MRHSFLTMNVIDSRVVEDVCLGFLVGWVGRISGGVVGYELETCEDASSGNTLVTKGRRRKIGKWSRLVPGLEGSM